MRCVCLQGRASGLGRGSGKVSAPPASSQPARVELCVPCSKDVSEGLPAPETSEKCSS